MHPAPLPDRLGQGKRRRNLYEGCNKLMNRTLKALVIGIVALVAIFLLLALFGLG
jgi:hypothetical protein